MKSALYVAAGGGGDVIGTAVVHAALGFTDELHIATFSWDRLLIDPVPGPRDPSWFEGLLPVGRYNHRLTPATRPRPPAGSTLPRLAGELPAALYLLDPRGGAVGLARQLDELAQLLSASVVTVVDVGGDILARGDEPGLRSPLADSMVLAALARHPLPVRVMVTGAGLDGELSPECVRQRCIQLGAQVVGVVYREAVKSVTHIFEWHLSEATGLLAAAAMGARGRAQIQAGRSVVDLTPAATSIHQIDLPAILAQSSLAQSLQHSVSLEQAQDALVKLGAKSEIDYERKKAEQIPTPQSPKDSESLIRQVDGLSAEAAAERIDLLTLRRLAEMLTLTGSAFAALQQELRVKRPLQYAPPVWVIRPQVWPMNASPQAGPRRRR